MSKVCSVDQDMFVLIFLVHTRGGSVFLNHRPQRGLLLRAALSRIISLILFLRGQPRPIVFFLRRIALVQKEFVTGEKSWKGFKEKVSGGRRSCRDCPEKRLAGKVSKKTSC